MEERMENLKHAVKEHGVYISDRRKKEDADDVMRQEWYNGLPGLVSSITVELVETMLENKSFYECQQKSFRDGFYYYYIQIPKPVWKWNFLHKTEMSPEMRKWYNAVRNSSEAFRKKLYYPEDNDTFFGLNNRIEVLTDISGAIRKALDVDTAVFSVYNGDGNKAWIKLFIKADPVS
jgi:hypothetical protein